MCAPRTFVRDRDLLTAGGQSFNKFPVVAGDPADPETRSPNVFDIVEMLTARGSMLATGGSGSPIVIRPSVSSLISCASNCAFWRLPSRTNTIGTTTGTDGLVRTGKPVGRWTTRAHNGGCPGDRGFWTSRLANDERFVDAS
jgi:hypothetical protein